MALSTQPPKLTGPVEYTSEQAAEFWKSANNEAKRSVHDMATPSVSLDIERLRKRSPAIHWLPFRRSSRSTSLNTKDIHDFDELDSLMAKYILNAESQAESHHSDQRVSKRVGRTTSEFLIAFRDYCRAYSGVVQLMAGVSQGYSTTALEALNLFVLIVVNKKETEKQLDDMIKTLKNEYDRIGSLTAIYSSTKMQECVATVFRLGIEFLGEAIMYYSRKPAGRILHVLCQPPDVELKAKVSAIGDAIENLVKERETLDRLRLKGVEDKLDLNLQHISTDLAVKRLAEINSLLDLPYVNSWGKLDDFASLLDSAFSRLKRLPPLDAEDLFSKPSFSTWRGVRQLESSSFLLIHGRTVAPHNTSLSWTSQACVKIVRQLQTDRAIVAWHLCEPGDAYIGDTIRARDPSSTAALALLSLGYCLLDTTSAGRAALASLTPEARVRFDSLQKRGRSVGEKLAAYRNATRGVGLMDCSRAATAFLRESIAVVAQHGLASRPRPNPLTMYFVVDRFDVIPLLDTALLRPLMELVRDAEAGTAVKVVVIGERKLRDQKGGDGVAEFMEDCEGKSCWGFVEIDQGS